MKWQSLAIFLILGLISGCDSQDKYPDLQAYVRQLKQQEVGKKQEVPPQYKLPVAATYHADDLASPFEQREGIMKSEKTNLDPLQAYSLSRMRFLGTMTKQGDVYGYILAPDDLIYQVKKGNIVGDHHGIVTAIRPGGIDIQEEDNANSAIKHLVTLQLKEEH